MYQVVTSDSRLSGVMDLWVTGFEFTDTGNVLFSGDWEIVSAGQVVWSADFVGLESANYLAGKPFQLSVSGEAQGSAANAGSTLHYRVHRASADWTHPSNSTLTLKAYIE